jgi:hypothetical protein
MAEIDNSSFQSDNLTTALQSLQSDELILAIDNCGVSLADKAWDEVKDYNLYGINEPVCHSIQCWPAKLFIALTEDISYISVSFITSVEQDPSFPVWESENLTVFDIDRVKAHIEEATKRPIIQKTFELYMHHLHGDYPRIEVQQANEHGEYACFLYHAPDNGSQVTGLHDFPDFANIDAEEFIEAYPKYEKASLYLWTEDLFFKDLPEWERKDLDNYRQHLRDNRELWINHLQTGYPLGDWED